MPTKLLRREIEQNQRKGRPSRMSHPAQAIRRAILAACAGGLLAVGFVPAASGAPGHTEDPRVQDAKIACAAGDVTTANRLLAELYAATEDPIWIFNQGRCFQQNGDPGHALTRFREYLRKAKTAPKGVVGASDISEAEQYIKELETEIAAQNNKGAPSEPTPPAPVVPAPAPVAQPAPAQAATAKAQPQSTEEQGRGLVMTGIALEIVGAAALIPGGVFSYLVSKTSDDANNLTSGGKIAQGADLRTKQDDGNRFVTMQYVFYAIGGVAAATGITLHIIGSSKNNAGSTVEVQPAISPTAWGLNLSVRL